MAKHRPLVPSLERGVQRGAHDGERRGLAGPELEGGGPLVEQHAQAVQRAAAGGGGLGQQAGAARADRPGRRPAGRAAASRRAAGATRRAATCRRRWR